MGTTTASPDTATQAKGTRAQKTEAVRKKSTGSTRGRNQKLGKAGEDLACLYLSDKGFTILERNWKCRSGEADLIAEEQDTLVFIEVKTRSAGYPGLPECAVTKQKRISYEKIALSYLMQNQRPSCQVRFDVIAVHMTGERQCLLRHHRDAFLADE
ncbi:MAG: YraN family protein [Coriobacteriales bacterium]|jgi:putative endonuclease|nr:YraN family protein [Coriobacteriales bacterium]